MIPLRRSESIQHFPKWSLGLIGLWFAIDVLSYFIFGNRIEFMSAFAWSPLGGGTQQLAVSLIFFGNIFSLLINLLYFWVFTPYLFEKKGVTYSLVASVLCAVVSLYLFKWIHPFSVSPVLCPEAVIAALLGLYMRDDIWGHVHTLVIGLGWVRTYEVPSYVLLFFWFFYFMIAQIFMDPPFSDGPMLYLVPLVSFLAAFLVESIRRKFFDHRDPAAE